MSETTTQEKPVFSSGTFGAGTVEAQPIVENTTSDTVVDANGQLENTTTQNTQETTATAASTENVSATTEENVSKFSFNEFGEMTPAETGTTEANQTNAQDWKELLKGVDRREVLKHLELDDFDIEFSEARKAGVDPYQYLEAKAFNWDKVGDVDVIRADLRKQYPTFSSEEIDRLINKKYDINSDDEDLRADGLLMLKADAHSKRELNKTEQKKFTIPDSANRQVAQPELTVEQIMLQIQEAMKPEQEAKVNYFKEHELTKALNESKRVGVEYADGKQFFFEVDQPEFITKAITDGEFWQRVVSANPKELDSSKLIPDVAKQQKIALYAFNPQKFEKDLINFGKSLGRKELIEEGQNAKRPDGTSPTSTLGSLKEAFSQAQSGTFGGNR